MNKFYIASSFVNVDKVRKISNQLVSKGFVHTYDWTKNERALSIEELREIGKQEKNAVIDADFIIVVFPAGKGSHIELGIALGLEKEIYLYSPNEDLNNIETTSTFYQLSEVRKCNGTTDDLIRTVIEQNVAGPTK